MTPEIEKRIKAVQARRVPAGLYLDEKRKTKDKRKWNVIRISELFDEVCEKNHPDAEVLTIIQGVGTVPREQSGREIIYDKNSLAGYKFVKKGDFIIHLRSFEGGLEVANSDGIVSPAYIILRPKIEVSTTYLYALFHTNRFINQTMAPAVEGARDGRSVKYDVLKQQKILFPPLSEQKKIAEILATQDRVIELKEKLITEKQSQKKYLMSVLLGDDLKKPFKLNGVIIDKTKWKRKCLKEIGTFSKGQGISREESHSGSISAIRYGEIYTSHNEYIKEFYSFISENIAKCSKLLKKGDLLFSCSGETKEDIGKCVAFISDIIAYAGGDIIILSPQIECDSKYLGFLMNSYAINKQRYGFGQGDSIVHISADSIGQIEVNLPTLPEQKAIADVLSAADEEISLLQKGLEQEKLKKKSLMQLLLTGIVRVKNLQESSK